jgi:hypothetical protein
MNARECPAVLTAVKGRLRRNPEKFRPYDRLYVRQVWLARWCRTGLDRSRDLTVHEGETSVHVERNEHRRATNSLVAPLSLAGSSVQNQLRTASRLLMGSGSKFKVRLPTAAKARDACTFCLSTRIASPRREYWACRPIPHVGAQHGPVSVHGGEATKLLTSQEPCFLRSRAQPAGKRGRTAIPSAYQNVSRSLSELSAGRIRGLCCGEATSHYDVPNTSQAYGNQTCRPND